jgi:hypothetical protein
MDSFRKHQQACGHVSDPDYTFIGGKIIQKGKPKYKFYGENMVFNIIRKEYFSYTHISSYLCSISWAVLSNSSLVYRFNLEDEGNNFQRNVLISPNTRPYTK